MRCTSPAERRPALLRHGIGLAFALATVNAAPTLSAWGGARRVVTPRLAGQGDPSGVALTFDDGPDPSSTPRIAAELTRFGWGATFFVLGEMARRHPATLAELAANGFEIGVHGDRHRMHPARTPRDVAEDLARGRDAVVAATGVVPRWFRPPHGYLSVAGLVAARRLDLQPVLWTTWGRDWTTHATPDSVATRVWRDLRPGGTILLHDADCTTAPGAWRATLGSLELLHARLADTGLRVVALRDHGIGPGRPSTS